MKRSFWVVFVVTLLLVSGGIVYSKYKGVILNVKDPEIPITATSTLPLAIPEGFGIEIFAKDLPGIRVIAVDPFKNFVVSQTSEGKLSMLEIRDGKVVRASTLLNNLKNPHGLAMDNYMLFYAEEHKVSRLPLYSDGGPEKLADLPSGGGHFTRTLGIGPDKKLYVSVGSSCNVCIEKDNRRAKVFSMNFDGSDFKEFARGLRNTVFFAWHPMNGEMWGTDMGRDNLGDNLPPDEINILKADRNYGWPNCFGKNIHDTNFDKNTYIRNPCLEPFEAENLIDIPAHSAPLGLAFIPKGWGSEYEGDLLVAYHGSWNRSAPTGYKIVRFELDKNGKVLAASGKDFVTGWLKNGEVLGRPVHLVFYEESLYVTDDKAGAIYRVFHK